MKRNKFVRQEPPKLGYGGVAGTCTQTTKSLLVVFVLDWYPLSSVILCVHSNLFFYSAISQVRPVYPDPMKLWATTRMLHWCATLTLPPHVGDTTTMSPCETYHHPKPPVRNSRFRPTYPLRHASSRFRRI